MKLADAMAAAEKSRPGALSTLEKLSVISELDMAVSAEIYNRHENNPSPGFSGYHESTPTDTQLLIPDCFASVYTCKLDAKADYQSGETERYNNSAILFNDLWQRFEAWWRSTHRPLGIKSWKLE